MSLAAVDVDNLLHVFRAMIDRIRIGDPIERWMHPHIWIEPAYMDGGRQPGFSLKTEITSPNAQAQHSTPIIVVLLPEYIGEDEAMYLAGNEQAFCHRVYASLRKMLEHELQESFYYDGRYLIDPHPEQRRA